MINLGFSAFKAATIGVRQHTNEYVFKAIPMIIYEIIMNIFLMIGYFQSFDLNKDID